MRFKSQVSNGFKVFAVTGTNTVSFAIDYQQADLKGLLGFGVERYDPQENEKYFLYGFKVFKSVIPDPLDDVAASTRDHPIQSFVYDDFTAKPDRLYVYTFHPLKGKPKNLDRSANPISIVVRTEKAFSSLTHDVFFNRGAASSQAYARRFGNMSPEELENTGQGKKSLEAKQWLSRDLKKALLEFIAQAKPGDTLLGCFYEFRFPEAADAFKKAIDRGVAVRLIIDGKENGKPGEEPFPRAENLSQIQRAGLVLDKDVILREARPSDIQHNKFILLLKGTAQTPSAVWTGSTNLSDGGIYGQTNVGHWIRDKETATAFKAYWDMLSSDPGGRSGDDPKTVRAKNDALRKSMASLVNVPGRWQDIPNGITPIFSPRTGLAVLDMYAQMLDDAKNLACITLAFGINKAFKGRIADNTGQNALTFFLLEREDKPVAGSKDTFVRLNAANNAYTAFGSFLRDPIHRWAKETSTKAMGLNTHVMFIHSKFLLKDPLGEDPIIVTGSANFSAASTNANDENMVVIRGNKRAADIYFTEFNRLFFHYYFRSVVARAARGKNPSHGFSPFLDETDGWLSKYKPGTLRQKRVAALTGMTGVAILQQP
ncbi:MAG: hypothetical protein HY795_06055 [Desulfovibrio sp.]|nr:hypothetical protein [Desulfovibrio sp.]MBI4961339.1 hypothetical protein [Desulfovibrio sp.]